MKAKKKYLKRRKVREQEYADGFNPDVIDEYEEVFDEDDQSFYEMHYRMERDRSLGHDELWD